MRWLEPAAFVVALAAFLAISACLESVAAALAVPGIIYAGRALFPKDPVAGVVGAATFAVALPIGGAGAAWALAFGLHRKLPLAALAALVAVGEFALHPQLALVLPTAPVVVGAGLLGAAFGAMTGLAKAKWVLLAIAIGFVDPGALLATCAVGIAVLPAAVVRTVGTERRELVALAAGVPLVLAALLSSM